MSSHAGSAANSAADDAAESRSRIVERVRKLMAFRDGTATEAEVENALSLAARLMEQHAIDRAEVFRGLGGAAAGGDGPPGGPDITRSRASSPLGGNVAYWESWLTSAVREAVPGVSCYTDTTTGRFDGVRRSRIFWYGPETAVEIARLLFDETRLIIATLAAGMYGGCYRGPGRSYAEGFAQALWRRIRDDRVKSERQAEVTAIVLQDAAANQQWLAREHGVHITKRSSRRGGTMNREAFEHGRTDGQRHEFSGVRPRVEDGRRRQEERPAD